MTLKLRLGLAALAGVLLGLYMDYVAVQHNPMEEFCTYVNDPSASDSCTLNIAPLFALFATWFVAAFVVIFALLTLYKLIFQRQRQ
ncbi:hypothetical protein ACKC9G_06130 [Pokkaliibacter sp. CJK22405]|uniref:hypothetical protein n=1 Tax=Pokkaliibacter sp. CJK22405 TaxID=3384615 RepID=UPI003984A6C0